VKRFLLRTSSGSTSDRVITSVERVKRTEKLYKILWTWERGTRQTSQPCGYYEADELVGKKVVYLTNLKQAKFAGEVSQGCFWQPS